MNKDTRPASSSNTHREGGSPDATDAVLQGLARLAELLTALEQVSERLLALHREIAVTAEGDRLKRAALEREAGVLMRQVVEDLRNKR